MMFFFSITSPDHNILLKDVLFSTRVSLKVFFHLLLSSLSPFVQKWALGAMPFGSGLPRIQPVRLASGKPQLALRAQTIGLLILSFAYRLLYSSTITSRHIPLAWEKNKRYIPLAREVLFTFSLIYIKFPLGGIMCTINLYKIRAEHILFPPPPPRVRTKVIEASRWFFYRSCLKNRGYGMVDAWAKDSFAGWQI